MMNFVLKMMNCSVANELGCWRREDFRALFAASDLNGEAETPRLGVEMQVRAWPPPVGGRLGAGW